MERAGINPGNAVRQIITATHENAADHQLFPNNSLVVYVATRLGTAARGKVETSSYQLVRKRNKCSSQIKIQ